MKCFSLLLSFIILGNAWCYTHETPEYHQIQTVIRKAQLFKELKEQNPILELEKLPLESLEWSENQWNQFLQQFLTNDSQSLLKNYSEQKLGTRNLGKIVRGYIQKEYRKIRTLGRKHGVSIIIAAIIIEIVSWGAPPIIAILGYPQLAAILMSIPYFPFLMGGILVIQSGFNYLRLAREYGGLKPYRENVSIHKQVLEKLHLKKTSSYLVKFPHTTESFILFPEKLLRKINDTNRTKVRYITVKNIKRFLETHEILNETFVNILEDKELKDDKKILMILSQLTQERSTVAQLQEYFPNQWISDLKEIDQDHHFLNWVRDRTANTTDIENIKNTFDRLQIGDDQTIFYFELYQQFILPAYTENVAGLKVRAFRSLYKKFQPFIIKTDQNPNLIWDEKLKTDLDDYFNVSFSSLK